MTLEWPLLLVEWHDAAVVMPDWTVIAEIGDPLPYRAVSVGYLIKENDDCLILAPHIGKLDVPEDRRTWGAINIPKCAVTARKLLTSS